MTFADSVGQIIGPLTIETLANGGAGIARAAGRVIFVAGAFPGDVAQCRLTKIKKSFAEAEVVELLQPSSLRRTPPCPVAAECGGCQWQQLPYAEQLKWKQQLFTETLVRQAGIASEVIKPIVAAPSEWGYRSRVQVKCFYSRNGFITGFYRPKSRFVVAVERCPLMADELNNLLGILRSALKERPLSRQIPQIDLALGADKSLRVVVHFTGTERAALIEILSPLAQLHTFDLCIQYGPKAKLHQVVGRGELSISVDQPEIVLNYAAGGFAQVNLEQNKQLVQAVIAAAHLNGDEKVLDLYCGMGNFSLPLARRAALVTGVEDFAPSIAMARRNAADNGLTNVDFQVMSSEQALKHRTDKFDLLVLDPPRAGAFDVAKQLSTQPVANVIYVSCDPQTLARDVQHLVQSGYSFVASTPFDMFPQTYHLESLTVLKYQPA